MKILALTFLTLSLSTNPLAAEPRHEPREPRGPRGPRGMPGISGMPGIVDQLNLSPEQREKISKLRGENKTKTEPLLKKLQTSQNKLNQAMENPSTPQEELKQMHKEHQELRRELGNLRFEHLLAVREILTPEQRKQYRELRAKAPRERRFRQEPDFG